MITISTISTKGGVGKTTITANLGALLADLGMRVLLIDADPQPSLSKYFCIEQAELGLTSVIRSGTVTPECVSTILLPPPGLGAKYPTLNPIGKLSIVVSDCPDGSLQEWLQNRIDKAFRLRTALASRYIRDEFDIVLIDTQGAQGNLQDASVLAADFLITPVSPDILSAREFNTGTIDLLDRLEPVSNMGVGVAIPHMKAIIYKADNTSDSRSISGEIREKFIEMRGKVSVLEATVPSAVAYKRSATMQLPVHWIDPHKASITMHKLVWELFPNLHGLTRESIESESAETDESDATGDAR